MTSPRPACCASPSDPAPGKRPRREILADMRAVVAKYPQGALVGEPVLIEEAFDLLDADGWRLNIWSTLLVMTVIVACFRSLRWLVLPLAVVQLALARNTRVAGALAACSSAWSARCSRRSSPCAAWRWSCTSWCTTSTCVAAASNAWPRCDRRSTSWRGRSRGRSSPTRRGSPRCMVSRRSGRSTTSA